MNASLYELLRTVVLLRDCMNGAIYALKSNAYLAETVTFWAFCRRRLGNLFFSRLYQADRTRSIYYLIFLLCTCPVPDTLCTLETFP